MSHFTPSQLSAVKVDEFELIPLRSEDAGPFFAFITKSRDHLKRFDPFIERFSDITATQKILTSIQELRMQDKSLSCGIWKNEELIGYIICGLDTRQMTAKMGYAIAKDYQGQGIIKRAAQVILTYAFAKLHMHHAWLTCWTTNTTSIQAAERLGFKRRETIPARLTQNGVHDEYKYVLENPGLN